MADTHEWDFGKGCHAIVTTTTGGSAEAPDFNVSGPDNSPIDPYLIRSIFAAEVLHLAGTVQTSQRVMGRLEATFEAVAEAFKVAAEKTAAEALDYLADYMNECDAVEGGDAEHYAKWVERGRP